jgi:hypothetical protein
MVVGGRGLGVAVVGRRVRILLVRKRDRGFPVVPFLRSAGERRQRGTRMILMDPGWCECRRGEC